MERTAIVTGGTGGLGAAVTRKLLDDGWRVVVPWFAERELERVDEHERLQLVHAAPPQPAPAAHLLAPARAGRPRRPTSSPRPARGCARSSTSSAGSRWATASTRRRSRSSSSSCA